MSKQNGRSTVRALPLDDFNHSKRFFCYFAFTITRSWGYKERRGKPIVSCLCVPRMDISGLNKTAATTITMALHLVKSGGSSGNWGREGGSTCIVCVFVHVFVFVYAFFFLSAS